MSLTPYRLSQNARSWSWLDDAVLPVMGAAIRLCWLWPWLEVLRRWFTPGFPHAWLPIWAIPLLILGGNLAARLVLARTADLQRARIWVAAIGLVAVLLLVIRQIGFDPSLSGSSVGLTTFSRALTDLSYGLPPALLTLIVAAALWLRSVQDAQRRRTRDDVWATSAVAYGAFALLALVGQLDPAGLPAGAAGWMIALVAVSLTALALSSLELARSVSVWGDTRGTPPALSRDWLLGVGLVIVVMLGVGLLLAAIFTPGMVAQALGWVTVVVRWVGLTLGYVAVGVAFVLFWLLTPLINWLMAQIGEREPAEPVEQAGFQQQFEEFTAGSPVTMDPAVAESLRWLGIVGLLIGIVIVFAIALRFFRAEREDDLAETRETILTRALLQEQLSALWRNWMARLQRAGTAAISPFFSLEDEEERRREIRGVYQALLALTKARGAAHTPAQTPGEYQARLSAVWPTYQREWQALTEEYVAARYGLPAPSPAQVVRMRQAWATVQAALTEPEAPSAQDTASPGNVAHSRGPDLNRAG